MTSLQHKYQPKKDEYFPEHNFGSAKIEGKPQNKVSRKRLDLRKAYQCRQLIVPFPFLYFSFQAWGSRELIALDSDGNKLIFFQDL